MKKLGEDPATGLEVTLRSGRFGPYVQLGEAVDGETEALACRKDFPPTTSTCSARSGSCRCRAKSASIRIGRADLGWRRPLRPLRAARQDLRQSRDRRRRAHRRGTEPRGDAARRKSGQGPAQGSLRCRSGPRLGEHPDKGGPVVAKNGRYGPYVSHDGVNATLPSDKTPETITLEEAVALLDARAARGGGKRPTKRRGGARKATSKTEEGRAGNPESQARAQGQSRRLSGPTEASPAGLTPTSRGDPTCARLAAAAGHVARRPLASLQHSTYL